jgi:2-dehydro-3-deoxyglucarate aldolase/4-hydroxy-2-oxoheptanedioate aldolase
MPSLHDRLAAADCLVGTIVSSESTIIAEAVALAGVDWVFFDLEHSTSTLATVQRQMQAIAGRAASVIRIGAPDPLAVSKALDTGCDGVIVPQVNSAAQARSLVVAAKYPPLGARGVGMARANGYGASFADYLAYANTRTALIPQIESREAVAAIDEIVAVPGIDGVFIGPYDLSSSLGMPGEVRHPDVVDAINRVRRSAREAHLPVGIFAGSDALIADYRDVVQLLLVGTDVGRLMRSVQDTVAATRRT